MTLEALAAAIRRRRRGAGRRRAAPRRRGRRRSCAIARPGDVVITLGAGSIGSVPDQLVEALGGVRAERRRRAHERRSRSPPIGASAARTSSRRASGAAGARWLRRRVVRRRSSRSLVVYARLRAIASWRRRRVLQIDRIVVHGNERLSKGEVLAVLSGLRGENLVWTDLDALAAAAAGVAVGRATPRCGARCRRRSRSWSRSGSRSAIGRIARRHVSRRRARRDHRSSTARSTPTSICRSSTACRRRAGDGGALTDEARADLAARVIAALQAKPDDRAAAVAGRRHRPAQRVGDPRAATRR